MAGAAGRGGPSNLKNKDIFSNSLGAMYPNFQQFPIKWSFGRKSQRKISTFIVKYGILNFLGFWNSLGFFAFDDDESSSFGVGMNNGVRDC